MSIGCRSWPQLQEQGMFRKGYFGEGVGGTFALVESEGLKYLVSLAKGRFLLLVPLVLAHRSCAAPAMLEPSLFFFSVGFI